MPPHRARKRFGQHFLHDPNVIGRIIAALAPQPNERIVEIGPGLGALTAPLLKKTQVLDVVELDRDVIPHLQERCAGLGTLRVHASDVLKFDFGQLAQAGATLRLVGNLPYNISTPLLFHVLEYKSAIRDMLFMVQKEVAARIAATPGSHDYGRLSVMVQYHCRVERLFDVGPGAFTPPPKVDSSVIRLQPYAHPPHQAAETAMLQRLVAAAFSARRKTLRNALKGLLDQEQISAAGVDPGARPEMISIAQYVALANVVAQR